MKPIVLYLLMLVLLSCETVINIDVPREKASLVVNSTLADNTPFLVDVSTSRYILDDQEFNPVTGATIEVFEDDNLLTVLTDSADGTYHSPLLPQPGKTYHLVVNKPGFDEASALVLLPKDSVQITQIELDTVVTNELGYEEEQLKFTITFKDDPNLKNYYGFSVVNTYYSYLYDETVDPPLLVDSVLVENKLSLYTPDPTLEEEQAYGQEILFNDEIISGKTYTMSFFTTVYYSGYINNAGLPNQGPNKFNIQLNNVSESYYYYKLSSQLQLYNEGNPFAQPVTVYNNITNGFGVLGAYKTSVYVYKP